MRKTAMIVVGMGTILAFFGGALAARSSRSQPETGPARKAIIKPGDTVTWPSKELEARIQAERAKQLTYKGTEVKPSAEAEGTALALQEEIAGAFQRNDPMPRDRRQALEWLYTHPNVKVLGWYGLIQKSSRTNGECLVELKVTPRLAGFGAVTFTNDYCVETWKYSHDKHLVFQKCVHQPVEPIFLFGD